MVEAVMVLKQEYDEKSNPAPHHLLKEEREMPLFIITYTDPETREEVVEEREFFDLQGKMYNITAEEWAEDYAYGMADKGPHSIRRKL